MKENTAQVVAQVPVDVGTFLLNEKRPEIHGIETRFKVNVLLVPNTYLETPNYKVQRLRHDDLNQGEPLPASFDMVERPEEEDIAKLKKEEAREPRPEAAVKGITPSQPAPVPVERAPDVQKRENWLSTVMGWFKRAPEDVVPVPPPQRRSEQRGEGDRGARGRHDRQGRRDRRDERTDERREARRDGQREPQRAQQGQQQQPSRRERDQGRDGQRGERREGQREAKRDGEREAQRAPQREAQRQQPRPPREAREPRASQEPRESHEPHTIDPNAPAITQGQPGAAHEPGEGGRRRRSRRRSGRDRGERHGPGEGRAEQGEARPAAAPAESIAAAEPVTPIATASESLDHAPAAMPVDAGALIEPAPVVRPPEFHETPLERVEASPLPEPIVARNAPEIPRVSLELPPDSGLVLVQTSHTAPPPIEEEVQPRPHRVRPARVKVAEEPLQLVETTHKDSTPSAE
jgi:ribonuclease E